MTNNLDIVIFGATGFTGKRTIPQLVKIMKSENLSLTWGIAGRSEDKLKTVLKEMGDQLGEDLSNIPVIRADVSDIQSIEAMTARCRVIINTVGPYRFLGEIVIKACLKTGTHHIDVSGEVEYIESMQLKYHKAAMEKKIFLISACGFDSIPADLGAIFLQKKFEGTLNSIETYLYTDEEGGPYPGATIHYTTYESAVHSFQNRNELRGLRSKLYPEKLPEFKPKLTQKGPAFKSTLLNKWTTPFMGSDRSVMIRTQRYLYETYKQRPAQIHSYMMYRSFLEFVVSIMMGIIFMVMCKFDFTASILLKYPRFFTCGLVSQEGPSDEKLEHSYFYILLFGEGWSEKLTDGNDNFTTPPDKTVVAKVSGKDPGYGCTGIALSVSAIMMLTEKDKMPKDGGCYPPGAAFANTSMIEKLNKYGLKFELNPEI